MQRALALALLALLLAASAPLAAGDGAWSCTGTARVDRSCHFVVLGCWLHVEVSHTGTGYIFVETWMTGGLGGGLDVFEWEFVEGSPVPYQLGSSHGHSCNQNTRTEVTIQTGPLAAWARCPLGLCAPEAPEPAASPQEHGVWQVRLT